jgi:deoxyribonuclease V
MAHPRRGRVSPDVLARWKARQAELATGCRVERLRDVQIVAGVDCAFAEDAVHAVAVAWDVAEQKVLAVRSCSLPPPVPYIPGYLSFREAPAVHAVLDRLGDIDAVLIDGQGRAHPRRCGLATHVGVERDVPTVGCAKSRLIGQHDEPGQATGDAADLKQHDEIVGRVVRTRPGTKPLFVSVGHRCNLHAAVDLVLRCRTKYRLPEPTRLADQLVARAKRGADVEW